MNKLLYEFLSRISAKWEMNVEYCKDCSSFKKAHSYNAITKEYYNMQNLFFATGINDITRNRSRSNINKVNRITIDIDYRKACKTLLEIEVDDDEIIQQWIDLWIYLKENYPNDYGQWNFIVFSGNGIHIHYIWNVLEIKDEYEADLYREATLIYYEGFDEIFKMPILESDKKVGDLWHLFRLPYTINIKNDTRRECKIVAYQNADSDVVNNLPTLMAQAEERLEIKEKKEILLNRISTPVTRIDYKGWVNAFDFINANVNIADLIQKLIPERTLKPDGKNFNDPNKKWKMNASYFIDKKNNVLIRNGSTKLPGTKEWFNPISLIQDWFILSPKDTLIWFVDNWYISSDIVWR